MSHKTFLLELYRRHAADLRGFIAARLRCDETAADLTQEVFARLSAQDGAVLRNPLAFAYRVARNLVVDHHRGQMRRHEDAAPQEFDDMPSSAPDPEDLAAARERLDQVAAAMAELPPQCRRAFVLNRFDGLSQVEVAQRMGISRQMAERHIAKAVLHLRTKLEESRSH
ncbi:putative RNA polymerase sigma factor FecI [Rhodocyclaceae bacterium]|nr:putative RNA polymerase sigma factor FecI [Rhodocyclaceae bacterium]